MPVLEKKQAVGSKRLNVSLSPKAFSDLMNAARETQRSMTELVRLGIGLVKLALEAERNGHRLIVASDDGKALKEIVLPT